MDVYDILTGHEDPSLWWITYVEMMIREYEKDHRWELDEDPEATIAAIREVEVGCEKLRSLLIKREEAPNLWGPA